MSDDLFMRYIRSENPLLLLSVMLIMDSMKNKTESIGKKKKIVFQSSSIFFYFV